LEEQFGTDPRDRKAAPDRGRATGRATRARSGAGGNLDRIRGAASGLPSAARRAASARAGQTETKVLVEVPTLQTREQPGGPPDAQDLALPNGSGPGASPRVTMAWKKAFAVVLFCFCVWLLCDAPTLMTNAEASQFGARRTVAMDVLRPIAWISRSTGLSHIVSAVDSILGRNGTGAVQISSGPTSKTQKTSPTTIPPSTIVTTNTGSTIVKPIVYADGWPPFPPISAASPLRVLIVGDSVGTDLGQYALVNDLGGTGVVSATLDGHISTGLTRPDYFNWPAELQTDLATLHPQLVIICIGANDPQNTISNGQVDVYGTQAWDNMYSARVGAFIAEATSAGARVLWVGMPPMASPQLNAQMQHLDYLYSTQVSRHIGSTYLSSVPSLGGPGGAYEAFKTVDGSSQEIRTDDGIHLQPSGAELLSQAVIREMDTAYHLTLKS